MFYQREKFKFVFIGAGSSVFTLRLVGDILKEDFIKGGVIALVDIDKKRLDEVTKGVERLIEHTKADFKIETHLHFKTSLENADFVFLTYAVGGYETWKEDIEISTKYNVNQSVGDTIGPGAIIRTLRSVPLALEIARKMEEICPDAYIINYTNPEGAQCLAILKYSKIKCFGLCHGTPDTAALLAREVFNVEPERLTYKAAGINHITWFTQLHIDGKDVYPILQEKLKSSGFLKKEPISAHLYEVFGLYPAPGDRHVSEFFSSFLKDNVLKKHDYTWKNNDFKAIDEWRENDRKKLYDLIDNKKGYEEFLKGSGETATHFIRSLATGEVAVEMVNTPNKGYIENISDDIIVEIPTFIDEFGLHPETIGKLPDGVAAKSEALGREYLLLVDAAVNCDMNKLLQVANLDPLCANSDFPEKLVKELVEKNLSLLPEAWKKFF